MNIKIILLTLLLSSCSTFKKTAITSAVIGGVVGGLGGMVFSPNKQDESKNAFLFGAIGSAMGVGGAFLFQEKPIDQTKLKQMLLDEQKVAMSELPLFDFDPKLQGLNPKIEFKPMKKYEVPLTKLPKELKGKVGKQYILEYESPARTLKLGARTIQISPFKAWEHVYEE